MYRHKDRQTQYLFPDLFPFGGRLNENNRWLRVMGLIPWEKLEKEYSKYFSEMGRPATDARLIIGLILLKHMTGLSDRSVVEEVLENPYMQAFCGFEQFVTEDILDPSTLARMRERLGADFFGELENRTYKVLIDRKIIRRKGILVNDTVFPGKSKYSREKRFWRGAVKRIIQFLKKAGKAFPGKRRSRHSQKGILDFPRNHK